jgi:NitT/TauT family transport system permease protein
MLDRATDTLAKDDTTRRVRFRGAGFVPASSRFGGWIALALVIAIWQAAGSTGLVNPLFLPAPSAIVRAIYELAISGALWQHLSASILRIGVGWVLGTTAGVAIGFAIGLSRLARSVGITFISALFPIPKIALLPLLAVSMRCPATSSAWRRVSTFPSPPSSARWSGQARCPRSSPASASRRLWRYCSSSVPR